MTVTNPTVNQKWERRWQEHLTDRASEGNDITSMPTALCSTIAADVECMLYFISLFLLTISEN